MLFYSTLFSNEEFGIGRKKFSTTELTTCKGRWISIEYNFLKLLSKIICLLPLKFCLTFGRGLASLIWIFLPAKRKKLATENICRCLKVSSEEADRIARESTVQFGAMFMEVLSFPKLKKNMQSHVKVVGLEHLTRYKNSSERGAVIMTIILFRLFKSLMVQGK